MKTIQTFSTLIIGGLLLTSCVGNTEHSWSARDSCAMVEVIDTIVQEIVQEDPVIPDELDDFVVTSQGGYGAYVKEKPAIDSERLMVYRDGTTFTGAYTNVPHWIMIIEDGHIVGYIHDENVSPEYDDYEGDDYEGDDYDDEYVEHNEQQTTQDGLQSDMNSNTTVVVGKTTQYKDLRILNRLKELDWKNRELEWDLQKLQNLEKYGRMDPQRYNDIKNSWLKNNEEQIELASKLNEKELVLKYQQQKQIFLQSY